MYHHRGKNISSRLSFGHDRHLFLQDSNAQCDNGLVLSTDAKPRLKWTPELHDRFVDAVNQLGGPDSTYRSSYCLRGI